jgi:hypothetical protein
LMKASHRAIGKKSSNGEEAPPTCFGCH